MERGSSIPWQETLREATGEDRLDASALREYFRPLEDWLRTENLRTGDIVGWSYDGDYCKRSIETAGLQVYGSGFYGRAATTSATTILPAITMILSTISILR
ncbi:Angiotensin-converting enzyme [Melipona quadrifasciata]|uniref:Angiotensin-converting enzyme n=1 Tax=Melipona quadrifasciata TaxID=166423 RepID=A0A0M9AB65_9HYME|nr:Angiotensin-converting enzyme [Melipona quadrifasciata]